MNRITVSLLIFCVLQSASCEENRPLQTIGSNGESMIIGVTAGEKTVTVKLEENEAAQELIRRLQEDEITCTVDDYGGFEKVGPLGFNLPRNDIRTNVRSGDIVLYSGIKSFCFTETTVGRIPASGVPKTFLKMNGWIFCPPAQEKLKSLSV